MLATFRIVLFKKILPVLFLLIFLYGCFSGGGDREEIKGQRIVRAWHFPDIVHGVAIVGRSKGVFREALSPEAKVEWKVFNAGPSAIEALFAGEVDIGYIGPNPAINGYIKSSGKALRIVCGAASGGAGLVIRKGSGIKEISQLAGKVIATPQLGNTQDVACRAWLKHQGFEAGEKGGGVRIVPIKNPDQLTLFIKGEIDGAWTKEPWVSRLIKEGGGELFLDERTLWPDGKFVTANLIVREGFLAENPDLVRKWITAHVEIVQWFEENYAEAEARIMDEIKLITGKSIPSDILANAFSRVAITYDPVSSSLYRSAGWAWELGFLGHDKPNLEGIYDLSLLNDILREKGLESIEQVIAE